MRGSCKTTNSGDLEVLRVRSAIQSRGLTVGAVSDLGKLAPSQTEASTHTVVAPSAPGSYSLVFGVSGQAYEEAFSSSATITYQVK